MICLGDSRARATMDWTSSSSSSLSEVAAVSTLGGVLDDDDANSGPESESEPESEPESNANERERERALRALGRTTAVDIVYGWVESTLEGKANRAERAVSEERDDRVTA